MFSYTTPVRFSDVDHAGIVYFPRYFHLFHLAFEELWRTRMGARAYVDLLDRDRVGFPAVSATCDFRAPLRFGDDAEIQVTVARLGTKSVTFRYRVLRVGPAAGNEFPQLDVRPRELAAEGTVVCAIVDLARFVAIPIPEQVSQMLADLVEVPG